MNAVGPGSLAYAISSSTAGDTIRFDKSLIANGNAVFTSPMNNTITKSLHFVGVDSAGHRIVFNGSNLNRAFDVDIPSTESKRTISFHKLRFINMKSPTNSGNAHGGAIAIKDADTVIVTNCSFHNCYASSDGSAIGGYYLQTQIVPEYVKIDSVEISNNSAQHYGCINFPRLHRIDVTNSLFTGNTTEVLTVDYGLNMTVSNCTFFNNSEVSYSSHSIHASSFDKVEVDSCIFMGNMHDNGSVSFRNVDSMFVSNCLFENNSSTYDAPCIFDRPGGTSYSEIANCAFLNNQSSGRTGAVNLRNGIIKNCIFRNNEGQFAGAIVADNTAFGGDNHVYISDNILDSNYSANRGGAVVSFSKRLTIVRNTITNNSSASTGGAIHCDPGTFFCRIYTNTIAFNHSAKGGALFLESGPIKIENNTIYGNSSSTGGDAIATHSPALDIKGNIVSHNYGSGILFSNLSGTSQSTLTSTGYNIIQPGGAIVPQFSDLTNVQDSAILLDTLAFNGGFGMTMLPLGGSPAANSGDPSDHSLHQNLAPIFLQRDRGAAEGNALSHFIIEDFTVCDSALIYGDWYDTATTVIGHFTNTFGADSIHWNVLDIQHNYQDTSVVTIDTCGPFVYADGVTYNSDTAFIKNIGSIHSCDSIVDVSLTITPINDTVIVNWRAFTATNSSATVRWYRCEDSAFVYPFHSFQAPDTAGYYAEIEEFGCVAYTECFNWSIGIAQQDKDLIHVYPNPTSSSLKISLPSSWNKSTARITDLRGRELILIQDYTSDEEISLNLPAGTYLVELINSDGSVYSQRVIVN
ncbi:MAG: right-handed parallel beta-helix repeat-containing protein [Oceanospirillaceae bacterium]|nr:right-handed parallel beta-helix repeat-containing protein [Oceanospirillaceae bacterium]